MTISVNGSTYAGLSLLQHHDGADPRHSAEAVNNRQASQHPGEGLACHPTDLALVGHLTGGQVPFGIVAGRNGATGLTGISASPLVSGGGSREAVAAVLEFDIIRNYRWISADTRGALRGACRELQKAEFCLTTLSQFKTEKCDNKEITGIVYAARVNSDLRALLIDHSRLARMMADDARAVPLAGELRLHAVDEECSRSLECLCAGINSLVARALDLGIALDPECKQMLAEAPWLLSDQRQAVRYV